MITKPGFGFRIAIVLALLVLICCVSLASAESVNVTPATSPFITIDPIGNHTIGDVFFINGTTNLPVSENLTIEILDWSWLLTRHQKGEYMYQPPPGFYAYILNISISSDKTGTNRWSANVTDIVKELESREYYVAAYSPMNGSCNNPGCLVPNAETPQLFTLLPANNRTTSTVLQTTIQNPSSVQSTTCTVIVPPMTQATPLPPVLSIAVFAALVILRSFRERKT